MVRVVTQTTFDMIVNQNVTDFDMSHHEAIADAKAQLLAQGVDLSNLVITDDPTGSLGEADDITKLVHRVSSSLSTDGSGDHLLTSLAELRTSLAKDVACRVYATKHGAYNVIRDAIRDRSDDDNRECLLALLDTAICLLQGNPDPFDEISLGIIESVVVKRIKDHEVIAKCISLLTEAMFRHEENRSLVAENERILEASNFLIADHPPSVPIVCQCWIAMVQDDDVRVPYGRAHEFARILVEQFEVLDRLCCTLEFCSRDMNLDSFCAVVAALRHLAVRNEYCQSAVDNKALPSANVVLTSMAQSPDTIDVKLVSSVLRMVKAFAGNDDVKKIICNERSLVMNIFELTRRKMASKELCKLCCDFVAAVALRCSVNSEQLYDLGAGLLIVEIMSKHASKQPKILTSCAHAIRNMVSRSQKCRTKFITDLRIELIISTAMDGLKSIPASPTSGHQAATDAVNGALRDLGLQTIIDVPAWQTGVVKQ